MSALILVTKVLIETLGKLKFHFLNDVGQYNLKYQYLLLTYQAVDIGV